MEGTSMMNFQKSFFVLALFSLFVLIGCGDKSKEQPQNMTEKETASSKEEMSSKDNPMSQLMGGDLLENKEPVPPVSFKVLMNYLPKEVAGLKAEKPRGESVQWEKWTHSTANIDFRSETDNQNVRVNIYDYAYISNLYLPYQMMFKMKFERESSEGYEKSTELNGMPTFEKWNEEGKDNEVTVLVGKRFIVSVETNEMPEGSARKIAEGMDFSDLASQGSK
jgi:hypothetical protein